jgi:membrane fusion protein (multidrug efflux system)
VRFPITTRKNAIVIPQRAVQELQGTYNVFVVGPDSIVQAKTIKPGNRVGSDWVISSGLEPADRIIVEGLQKVRPGAKVRPIAPKPTTADTTKARDSTAGKH